VTYRSRSVALSLVVLASAVQGGKSLGPRSVADGVTDRVSPSPARVMPPDSSGRPRFRLAPTPAGRPASGWVELVPAQSPFGVAATNDGRLVFDLDIVATDLPPVSTLGAYTHYEVWLATPKLDIVHDLGPIANGAPVHAQADWNKFTIIVSAESSPVGRRWGAAIALIGRSQSSLMQSFASHPLFSTPEPD
jgi:hypothetical protein